MPVAAGDSEGCEMSVRLISSAVASAIAIGVLLLHHTVVFPIAIAAVCVILLFELFRAAGCLKFRLSALVGFLYGAGLPFLAYFDKTAFRPLMAATACILLLLSYILQHERMSLFHAVLMVFGTFLIPYSMCCCITMNEMDGIHGIIYVVLALCGAWLADSGAYFVGTFCGKHKLCPKISPKKTVEGFIGGVVTNGILFVAFAAVYCRIMAARGDVFTVHYGTVCLLGMACALIGTVGDLTASLIKRHFGIKDYGNIMPGHGGLLDRFDSVLLVVPFFCAVLQLTPLYKF